MKVQATDTFFKSLQTIMNKSKFWRWEFYDDMYYNLKWKLWALRKYFKIVITLRPWDFHDIIYMMHFQSTILLKTLENGHEIDKTRLPKVKKLKRFIELSKNYIEDMNGEYTYEERCGYDDKAEEMKFIPVEGKPDLNELVLERQKGFEHLDFDKIRENSKELREKEWKEMWKIIKNEARGWWD